MHQFLFLHGIPRDPVVYAPLSVARRDVYAIFDDFYNYLVLEEARSVSAPQS